MTYNKGKVLIGGEHLSKDNKSREKSKIETDDGWNRALYGSPTIGGLLVMGAIILFIIFNSIW